MLLTCTSCGSMIRVPETAVGKRVKCPKCATILNVPAASTSGDAEATAVSSAPLPPPLPPVMVEPEPEATTEIAPSKASGAKPPPIKSENDEEAKPSRRRWEDEEDDQEDLDIRRPGGLPREQVNGMAMTGMIMGIVAVSSLFVPICCCGLLGSGMLSTITGVLALIFGFLGRVPGSESHALTGIICGAVAVVLGVLEIVLGVALVGVQIGAMNF
jgi:hypothetical protein